MAQEKQKRIPEIMELEQLFQSYHQLLRVSQLGSVSHGEWTLPLYGFTMGSTDPLAPTIGLFAGVHGLERIGTHVLLAFLNTLLTKVTWEEEWNEVFKRCRLVSIPIINPLGMALNRRSNANGVDLMRNAPVDAVGKLLLGVSGQRYSAKLPWFRGQQEAMEIESQAVVNFVQQHMFDSVAAISLDLHSGFGLQDRLWYPWAKCAEAFPHELQVKKVVGLFEKTYPYHIYKIEPQNESYMTHGDLWDYLYSEQQKKNPERTYLPLTLEMGSWMWVKKNPWQVFSMSGLFNPVKKHRYARTMRRHLHLLEFLVKAIAHHKGWAT